MAGPERSPPSPSNPEPSQKLFKAEGLWGSRTLPPPPLPLPPPSRPSISEASIGSRPSISSIASSSDFSFSGNPHLERPHSISSADSGYYTSQSIQAIEAAAAAAKPRSQSYPTNFANASSRLYTVHRSSIDQPKQVVELSDEQRQLPPSQPLARQACVPCRKKKVGCDLRQPGNASDPPCRRCRQDEQHCFFSAPPILAQAKPVESQQPLVGPNGQSLPSLRDMACQHCSSVFLRDEDLRQHLRSHCPEKHYVCSTCHSRFKRLNDLDRHNRIHTGERPHKCEICRRTFSRATTLSRHKQGPEGCAGRRADIGRRRLGSFQGPTPDAIPEGADEQGSGDDGESEVQGGSKSLRSGDRALKGDERWAADRSYRTSSSGSERRELNGINHKAEARGSW